MMEFFSLILRREQESFHLLKLSEMDDGIFLFYQAPRDEQIFLSIVYRAIVISFAEALGVGG